MISLSAEYIGPRNIAAVIAISRRLHQARRCIRLAESFKIAVVVSARGRRGRL